jgi:hypothetical protein
MLMCDKLNKLLMQGILPEDLNFGKKPDNNAIDMNKLKYNSFYKEYEYHAKNLPKALNKLPGFDNLVKHQMDLAVTPLEALDLRALEKNISDINLDEKEKGNENIN